MEETRLVLEMRIEFAARRSVFERLRGDIRSLEVSLCQEVVRAARSHKILMVCVTGVELAVMAHGFKWL